jgi:methylaspartate ammonia-lyase
VIEDILFAAGLGAFFYDDQEAIRQDAASDGFLYTGLPLTSGFPAIRIPSESLSIGLRTSDRVVLWGDMMGVQYSGAGGRDPLFNAKHAEAFCRDHLVPRLRSLKDEPFRTACAIVLAPVEGRPLPRAVEYGVSQALLKLVAYRRGLTMAEAICREYDLPVIARPIPIYAQSGDARMANVDKMILKKVDILPHGLINARCKFGPGGQDFRAFVRYVADRVRTIGASQYRPILHFDVYGMIGLEIGMKPDLIADFIASLAAEVAPLRLHIECPADYGDRAAQIEYYASIAAGLTARGSDARIVVDERCNTLDDILAFAHAGIGKGLIVQIKMPDVGSVADSIEAVLACKAMGVGAYLGGSCTETEISAAVSVHVAVATQPDMMLAKPGMGVDEALTIMGNEQSRLLAMLA